MVKGIPPGRGIYWICKSMSYESCIEDDNREQDQALCLPRLATAGN